MRKFHEFFCGVLPFACVFAAQANGASAVTGISLGSSAGASLDVGSRLPVKVGTLFNLQGQIPAPGRWKDKGLFIESSLRFSPISYAVSEQERSGTYFAFTAGGGMNYELRKGIIVSGSFHLIPFSTMVVASSSRSEVNGKIVKHAALSRYEGGFGFQERLNVRRNIPIFGWKFLGAFLGLSHMQHAYAKRSNESLVSDAELRVKSKMSESFQSKLTMITLEIGMTAEL